jgi:hypothetical protein
MEADMPDEYMAIVKRENLPKAKTLEEINAALNAPAFDGRIELRCGACEASYPKGYHVESVWLMGMRNRMIKLKRVRWSDLEKYSRDVRGLPQTYALEFRERKVRIWPAALQAYTLILARGEPEAEAEPNMID